MVHRDPRPASPTHRLAAGLVDAALLFSPVIATAVALTRHCSLASSFALLALAALGLEVFACRLWLRTIGQRVARVYVVTADGDPPSWSQVVARNVVLVASIAATGGAFLAIDLFAFASTRRPCLHDRLTKTIVVRA